MLKRCLTLVGLVYVLSLFNISDAAAKICFLPDGSCGTGKITGFDPKPNVSGCQYKSRTEAEKGMGECETVYPKEPCYYRKCNSDNKTIFDDYTSCQKKLGNNQECTSCGSCYKLVTKSDNTPNNNTCSATEATCKADGKGFETNGTYDSNGTPCGICKVNESCPYGYSTIYQSQSDCLTGEAFSSSGTANGNVCGKCTYQCSDYTLTSTKDSHCYSCSSCQYDTSKYKCTESVQSGYQLVNGVCSKKTDPDPDPEPDPVNCPSGYTTSSSCATDKGFTLFENPNYAGCYQCQCRSQGQINGKCTTCSAEGYTESVSSDMECELCPINKYQGKNCKCKATCPDGYSFSIPTIGSCGSSAGVANGGWSFDSKTVCGKTCGKCSKNSCPAGTSTSKSQVCVGGQSLTFSGKYSGDDSCMSCEGCPTGYSTRYQSVADCGTQGSNGWNFTTSGTSSGQKCGKCTAKSCPSGYQTGTPSCTSQSANKIPYGYNYSSTYAGDESCKKCKYRYRYTCSDNGLVNVGGGCGLKVCDYNCGYTYCNYSTRSDRQYTTFQGACYEYTPGPTEWYVEE